MGTPLRPWRAHDRSNTISDRAVVSFLADNGPACPRDIAQNRFRENVIRIQCRYLERLGVLSTVAMDAYRPVPDWEEVFNRNTTSSSPDYIKISKLVDNKIKKITDLSIVSPKGLKEVNLDFFQDNDLPYGYVRGDKQLTQQRISNIKDYRIDRIVREFPRTEPLCCQCAHWVRAIVGLHLFPDANHRTAMGSLYVILNKNGLEPDKEWPFDWIDIAVTRSKLLRGYHCNVRFDTLWERDELYLHWLRYFRDNFVKTDRRARNRISADFLDQVLEEARELRRQL